MKEEKLQEIKCRLLEIN